MNLRTLFYDCQDAPTIYMAMIRVAAFPEFPVRVRARVLIAAKPELKSMGTVVVSEMIAEMNESTEATVNRMVGW